MPDELKARVQQAAEKAGRSVHAELIHRLANSFIGEGHSETAAARIAELERAVIDAELAQIGHLHEIKTLGKTLLELVHHLMGGTLPPAEAVAAMEDTAIFAIEQAREGDEVLDILLQRWDARRKIDTIATKRMKEAAQLAALIALEQEGERKGYVRSEAEMSAKRKDMVAASLEKVADAMAKRLQADADVEPKPRPKPTATYFAGAGKVVKKKSK